MRLFAFPLFIVAAVAQSVNPGANPAQPPKKARIEGSVVSLTGEPIPRAILRLIAGAASPNTPITADDAGKFVIEDITPRNDYRLLAQRPGYINGQYGARSANGPGATLALAEGEVLKGLTITMTPQAVISGKVTDEDNDRIVKAVVMVGRIAYQHGARMMALAGSGATDDKGEYRIANLAPGRYYLAVGGSITVQGVGNLINGFSDRTAVKQENVGTYYPNAADLQSATPLNVTPGSDLRERNIRMRRSRTFSVRGKAVNSTTGGPAGILLLRAVPKPDAGQLADLLSQVTIVTAKTAEDGTFELRNMSIGEWKITGVGSVALNGGSPTNLFGDLVVSVRDQDVSGMVLELSPGASISGSLRLEGGEIKAVFAAGAESNANAGLLALGLAAAPLLAGRPLVVLTDAAGSLLQSVQTNEDATFKMAGVAQGKYALYLSRVPDRYYVKSVLLGGKDVTHGVLDFASSGGSIDIILADKPGELSGSLHNEKSESMAAFTVALWTKDPELASATNGVRTAYTDQNGGFHFKTLPPGDYYLAAWEDGDAEQLQNRELLAMFSDDSTKVQLAEGAKQSAEAKLITAEKLAAAVAKLP